VEDSLEENRGERLGLGTAGRKLVYLWHTRRFDPILNITSLHPLNLF
jgi:hypothetical protein